MTLLWLANNELAGTLLLDIANIGPPLITQLLLGKWQTYFSTPLNYISIQVLTLPPTILKQTKTI
jgi:hypothetical protein